MAPYSGVLTSNYKWKPIRKRNQQDRRWENKVVLQRYMGVKAWLILRNAMELHLKKVDREPNYAFRHAAHSKLDDNIFFSQAIRMRLIHFKNPASSEP